MIPIEFSFYAEFPEIPVPFFRKIALSVFLLDMLKSMNTAYYSKGTLVIGRREVVVKYIKDSLFVDLITIFPLWIHFYFGKNHQKIAFLNVLFFLKYFHFKRIRERLEEFAFFDENLLALVKLLLRIVLFSHIFACLWYFIGTTSKNSWISMANLEREDWASHYIHSFYFIIVTMNTVGFGDLKPNNDNEILFVIFFIFIGCGLFAVNLNQIGIILSNISKNSKEYHKELNLLNEFMLEKNINFELRTKIRKYLQYIWQEENLEQFGKQLNIINKLSDSLKAELLIEANGPFLRDLKLFNLNFSEETLRETVNIMNEKRYTPGDLIFSQNNIDHQSIYIIRKGEIELFNENTTSLNSIKKLHSGDIFAETSFFSGRPRSFSARSIDFSNVFVIKQEDFFRILHKNKMDLERFCQIKDNINLYEDYGDLFLKCVSCLESSHRVRECPLLHYIPKKEIVILRHIYSEDQIRKRRLRKRARKSPNSLINKLYINNISVKFQREIMNSVDNLSEEDSNNSITNNEIDIIGSKIVFQNDQTRNIIECEERNQEEQLENINKKSDDDKTMINSLEISPPDQKQPISTSKVILTKKIEKSSQRCSFGNDCESFDERGKDYENASSSNANQHRKSSLINQTKNNLSLDGILELLIENMKTGKFSDKNNLNKLHCHERIHGNLLENHLEIDQMKSYDAYFPNDNFELVLARVSEKKLLKGRRNRINNRTNISERKNYGDPRKKFEHSNSPFQRKFFKNEINLEKLIQEEQFDRHRFKEKFLKNIEKNKKKTSGFFKISNFLFEKNGKKTVLRVKRKKNQSKKLIGEK